MHLKCIKQAPYLSAGWLTNILGSEDLKKLEISINKYMLFLSKIEYLMELNKINFSSREEKNILISKPKKKKEIKEFLDTVRKYYAVDAVETTISELKDFKRKVSPAWQVIFGRKNPQKNKGIAFLGRCFTL